MPSPSPSPPHLTGTEVATLLSPHIRGKIILTTGVSPSSLGSIFLHTIAAHSPRLLILAGRNTDKFSALASDLSTSFPAVETRALELDLASLESVRKAAEEVKGYSEGKIDVLVCNAGVMGSPVYRKTVEGFEEMWGANHLGHFLLGNLIIEQVLRGGEEGKGGRVICVSSDGYRLSPVRFEDWGFDNGKTYDPWRAYGQSKTANMLFAVSLAEKLGKKGLVALSLHPGAIMTNLASNSNADLETLVKVDRELGFAQGWRDWSTFQFKTHDEGTATHVRAAFDPSLAEYNGRYLEDAEVMPEEQVRSWARDKLEAERLWKLSEELVGQKFTY